MFISLFCYPVNFASPGLTPLGFTTASYTIQASEGPELLLKGPLYARDYAISGETTTTPSPHQKILFNPPGCNKQVLPQDACIIGAYQFGLCRRGFLLCD